MGCVFSHKVTHSRIELDASLQGMVAICNNEVYAIQFPLGFNGYNITHLEMLNILVALRLWGYRWQGQRIVIKCVNQAVVTILFFYCFFQHTNTYIKNKNRNAQNIPAIY